MNHNPYCRGAGFNPRQNPFLRGTECHTETCMDAEHFRLPFLQRKALIAIITSLEIIHRGIWNFFRQKGFLMDSCSMLCEGRTWHREIEVGTAVKSPNACNWIHRRRWM
ncbi:uncharacterized protein LOC120289421 [Eucalyptus grandis]|uniref:uncharacterized protein LOC120289421 n=1 Tax=Eucalyptus grandis TaxID=71139 RepID=UPI00192E9323|nr:uncharacterized protein LOC120289421 [Eucalyptus grandis]